VYIPESSTFLHFLCGCSYSLGNLVCSKLLAPLLVGLPHDRGLGEVKLAGTEEAEEGLVVEAVVTNVGLGGLEVGGDEARLGELLAELGKSGGLGLVAEIGK
jgi:hypothetical protein